MFLDFEKWINKKSIPQESLDTFLEAILCYKFGAYKASLLFSYIGFQLIVKDRILNSNMPQLFPKSKWIQIHNDLRNNDKWDSAIFEAIQIKTNKEIFHISEDLRNQVAYWKNRRNDCAHSKSNTINASQVESFWFFIKSNLSKFIVIGGKDELLNKVKDHFDISKTPPNQDIGYIVKDIPSTVDLQDYEQFLNDLLNLIRKFDDSLFSRNFTKDIIVIEKIISLNSLELTHAISNILKRKDDLLLTYLRKYPHHIVIFSEDKTFIRGIWYDKLFGSATIKEDFSIYCSILKNNLIPEDQMNESFEHIIRNRLLCNTPCDDDFIFLKNIKFFDKFKEIAFIENKICQFEWSKKNVNFIIYYLSQFEMDETIAESIYFTFNVENYPFKLAQDLELFLNSNEYKKNQLIGILEKKGHEKPEKLNI
jgi:hypothetical protein